LRAGEGGGADAFVGDYAVVVEGAAQVTLRSDGVREGKDGG